MMSRKQLWFRFLWVWLLNSLATVGFALLVEQLGATPGWFDVLVIGVWVVFAGRWLNPVAQRMGQLTALRRLAITFLALTLIYSLLYGIAWLIRGQGGLGLWQEGTQISNLSWIVVLDTLTWLPNELYSYWLSLSQQVTAEESVLLGYGRIVAFSLGLGFALTLIMFLWQVVKEQTSFVSAWKKLSTKITEQIRQTRLFAFIQQILAKTRHTRLWRVARRGLVYLVVAILILDAVGVLLTARPVAAEWTEVKTQGFWPTSTFSVGKLLVVNDQLFAGTTKGVFRSDNLGQNWQPVGGELLGQNIHTVVEVSTQFYIGATTNPFNTSSGGVFRSDDGGQTWQRVNNGLTSLDVTALVIADEQLFAGTSVGLFRSDNGGQSWQPINEGLANLRVQALVVENEQLFASTTTGVFRSDNFGESWQPVTIDLSDFSITTFVANRGQLFAGSASQGIIRSDDGGKTWQSIYRDQAVMTMIAVGQQIFAGTMNSGIIRSENGGQSWQSVNEGLTNQSVWAMAVIGEYLFAGTITGVFRSDNGGESWQAINNGLSSLDVRSLSLIGEQVFAATNQGVFHSIDGGRSWHAANSGLSSLDIQALAVAGERLYAGSTTNFLDSSGGVFRSDNGGQSWQPVNSGLSNLDIHSLAVNDDYLFAGTTGGVFRSDDGGQSWQSFNNELSTNLVPTLLVADDYLFAGTVTNGVFRSGDNGQSWQMMNNGLTNLDIRAMAVSGEQLFAAALRGSVFRSEDDGQSWQATDRDLEVIDNLTYGLNSPLLTLITSNERLFAGTLNNGVFYSHDRGRSWKPLNNQLSDVDVQALVVSGEQLYIGTSQGMFRSNTNGQSLKIINNGLASLAIQSLVIVGEQLFAGTVNNGIFRSNDGGLNWEAINNGLSTFEVQTLISVDGQLFAGMADNGVFRLDDTGENWKAVNSGLSSLTIQTLVADGHQLFAGTTDSGVFRLDDNGQKWEAVNNGLTSLDIQALVVADRQLFAGTSGGVFHSGNGGQSWQSLDSGPTSLSIRALGIAGEQLIADTFIGSYHSDNGGQSWTEVTDALEIQTLSHLGISNEMWMRNGLGYAYLRKPGMGRLRRITYRYQTPQAFKINEATNTATFYAFAGSAQLFRAEVSLPLIWDAPIPYLSLVATTWRGIGWVNINRTPLLIGFGLTFVIVAALIYNNSILANRFSLSTSLWLMRRPRYLLPAARYRPYQDNVDAGNLWERLTLLTAPSQLPFTAAYIEVQLSQLDVAYAPESLLVTLNNLVRHGLLRQIEGGWKVVEPALLTILQWEKRQEIAVLAARTRQEHPLFSETQAFLEAVGFTMTPAGAFSFLAQSSAPHLPTLFARLVIGRSLDMATFQTLLDEVATAFPGQVVEQTALVVIERPPKTSDLHQIFAIRAEKGLTIVPFPQSLIIQGRLDNREAQVLQEQLALYTGRADLYDMRTAVSDVLSFFGRTATLAELKRQLLNGRSMILFGVRKVGKSSLLGRLREECNWPIAVVDLEGYSGGLHYLYQDALAGWQAAIKATRPELTLPQWNFEANADEAAQAQQFRQAVGELLALLDSQPDRPGLLLFLDEMDVLFDQPQYASFAAVLRSLAEGGLWRGRFALLVAGLDPRLNRLDRLNEQRNPFFAFFSELPVGLLEPEDSQTMIISLGGQMGVGYSDDALALLKEAGGGHPFLTRQLCSYAVRDQERPLTVDATQAKAAIDAYLRQPHNYLAESLWGVDSGGPPAAEAALLKALAADQPQTEASLIPADLPAEGRRARQVALSRLQDQSLVEQTAEGWVITIPLYRRWLRQYILNLSEEAA